MTTIRLRNRQDAAQQLAARLKALELHDPLVLGIPRGGVVTAAVLAGELGAELDVVLARKLRHPMQPELAVGAVSEEGAVFINEHAQGPALDEDYLQQERKVRMAELEQRRKMFRAVRPAAEVADRSVILTDDGIATGSTMLAALQIVKSKGPRHMILAVPVAPTGRFEELRAECDEAIALVLTDDFTSIGQFYEDFEQVDDRQVCQSLRQFPSAARR